ncbi:hypothetical protein K2F54_04160 [Cryobacterium sp. 1639]|uniref:hypothetical protein n=1 Tax=Cryobacterium inferilacus TaxID=2866629 RepID=UPI001C72FA3A|nr:hypothetical protein [Cryobacterium sp. 1639]MBX0299167.1 hypothetical protein [Cryobacterium sp. 1639]
MIGSLRSSAQRPGRPGLSVVLALAAVTSVALTGCAATPAASIGPTASAAVTPPAAAPPAATPSAQPADTAEPADTAAPAPDATPAAGAITAETPLDALAAWAICKALGDGGNQSVHRLTRVYDPANITPTGTGFSVQLIGDVGAQSDTDSWCDVSGTFGDPRVTFHLLQAEPSGLTPSPAFTVAAPADGERTAGSPMDALTAWAVCTGFERGIDLELESETGIATNAYDSDLISAADGTFTVYILGSADSTGPTATCTVSGALGDPIAEYLLPR